VFDKLSSMDSGGRTRGAAVLPANGVRVLDMWGIRSTPLIHSELTQVGTQTPSGRVILSTDQKSLSRDEIRGIRQGKIPDSPPIALGWGSLLSALENKLSDSKVSVHYNHKIAKVEIDPEEGWEITLTFANGNTHTCDVLIGADGIDSIIRGNFFKESIGEVDSSQWIASGVCNYTWPTTTCFESRSTGSKLWATSVGKGLTGWHSVLFSDKLSPPDPNSPLDETFKSTLVEALSPAPADALNAVRETHLQDIAVCLARFGAPLMQALNMYEGRLVLVGDSAQPLPDAYNQNIAMILESAETYAIGIQQGIREWGGEHAEAEENIDGAIHRAAEIYEGPRIARVGKMYPYMLEETKLLNTTSSFMSGLRSTADWMNSHSNDIFEKELIAHNIFK